MLAGGTQRDGASEAATCCSSAARRCWRTHEGQKIIAVSYRSLEVFLAVAAVYLLLTGSTAWLLRRAEYRLSASRRLG